MIFIRLLLALCPRVARSSTARRECKKDVGDRQPVRGSEGRAHPSGRTTALGRAVWRRRLRRPSSWAWHRCSSAGGQLRALGVTAPQLAWAVYEVVDDDRGARG